MERENIWPAEEKKKQRRKRGKYFEKENIWSAEEKKNREGKRGKYFEKEKEENIWRREIFFCHE